MAQNPVRPGNREKGWNDPPEFLHSVDESTTSQTKRNQLNKRVSHTLDGLNPIKADQNIPEKPLNLLNAPPLSSMPPISSITPKKPIEIIEKPSHVDPVDEIKVDEISIADIENILNESVKILKDNDLGARVCEDILKRVKIFVNNWPKLNPNVKLKIFNLTKALERSEYTVANDIHLQLILDYPSEASWMVGFKKLIHELINFSNKKQQTILKETIETTEAI